MIQLTTSTIDSSRETWVEPPATSASKHEPLPRARHDVETSEKIEQTIAYMMDHLDRPLHIASLAAMACVSPSHYFALFKRRTGCAPLDFFIRARMKRAGSLLEETALQIKEVAALLGYDDQFYFSRLFKSVHGIPPSEYRVRGVQNGRSVAPPVTDVAATPLNTSAQIRLVTGSNDRNQPGAPVIKAGQPAATRVAKLAPTLSSTTALERA